jgi:hypothetical protein
MTHSAQLDPCVEQKFDDIKYQVAYSEQTHRVSYVYTDDPKFRTTDDSRARNNGWVVAHS